MPDRKRYAGSGLQIPLERDGSLFFCELECYDQPPGSAVGAPVRK
jgi:hypothetical protein